MYCENCGAKIRDGAKFCKYCGARQDTLTENLSVGIEAAGPSEQQKATDKQKLIEHLGALYTAEMGIVYADQLIEQLETQKKDTARRHTLAYKAAYFEENVPVRRDCAAEAQAELDKWIAAAKQTEQRRKFQGGAATDWFAHWIVAWEVRDTEKKITEEEQAQIAHWQNELRLAPQRQRQEDQRWDKAMQKYNADKTQFETKEKRRKNAWERMGAAMERSFDASIANVRRQREDFVARRKKLYDMDIVYEQFRDPVAEFQLREYLRMGLVDELEGPQGGYAFYLKELQAKRICGSIQELRLSMEKHLDELAGQMSDLARQLSQANKRLTQVRNAVFDCCESVKDGFSDTIQQMSSTSKQLQKEIERQTTPIRDAVQRSEYNQYLESMRKELDNYNYGRLRVPTLDEAR